jgi:hypothetical protein
MQASNGDCGQPSGGQDLVCLLVGWEHGSPAPDSASFHVGVASRKQDGEDVEGYEASIGDKGEEVVAG